MNWYIGQEIVCIDKVNRISLVPTPLKEGEIYTIKALRKSICRCAHILIDIGFTNTLPYSRCAGCQTKYKATSQWWFNENRFRPLEYNTEAIAELLEQKITI